MLTLNIQPVETFEANTDADKIRQVISNFIDNSVKYTPKGSVAVSLNKDLASGKYIFKKYIRAQGVQQLHTEVRDWDYM